MVAFSPTLRLRSVQARIQSELLKTVLNRKTIHKTRNWRLYETVVYNFGLLAKA